MKERFIIIIVAIIAGLFITSAGFFIYQSTKKANDIPIAKVPVTVTQTPKNDDKTVYVNVSEPRDESLTTKRTLVIKGATNPDNLIVISTNLEDVQVKPSSEGAFSVSIDIDAGANEVVTRAIAPDGSSAIDVRTITYSTEEF